MQLEYTLLFVRERKGCVNSIGIALPFNQVPFINISIQKKCLARNLNKCIQTQKHPKTNSYYIVCVLLALKESSRIGLLQKILSAC